MFTDDELYLILNLINQPMKMDIVVAERLIELDKEIEKLTQVENKYEELKKIHESVKDDFEKILLTAYGISTD